jgi:predicted lipoprotein
MVASNCELSGCAIYLTRHLTNNLAAASNNKPARNAIIAALTVLPCRRVKALSLDALCQAVASYVIDKAIEATGVVEKAQRASSQKACLVVNLGYSESNTSWSPLNVDVYNGPKCRD